MQVKQRLMLDTFTQVNSFIDSKPAALANSPEGYDEQVTAFKTALSVIQQATATQVTATKSQASTQRQAARQALRVGQLHPLRKIARVLERTVAGMPKLVTIPKKAVSTQALLAAARVTVQDVTPYQAQFVSKGMPSNFLDQLNQSIQTLQDTDSASAAAQQLVKRAQGQLATAMIEAKDAVTCLDVIIRRVCAGDPVNGNTALNAWNAIIPPPAKLTVLGNATPQPPGGGGTAAATTTTSSANSASSASGTSATTASTSAVAGDGAASSGDTSGAAVSSPAASSPAVSGA